MEQKILANWFEALNRRDFDSIRSLYADNAIIHGRQGDVSGPDALTDILDRWINSIPDAQLTVLYVTTNEDVVIVHWCLTGTQRLVDQPEAKAPVQCHGITFFRCQNEQVIEHWAEIDYRALKCELLSLAKV